MVGVAGRSKGCATCRKRKVKCDLARPTCERCMKSRIQCQGYDRFPVFIIKTTAGTRKRRHLEEVKPLAHVSELEIDQSTALQHVDGQSEGRIAAVARSAQDTALAFPLISNGACYSDLALSWFYEHFANSQGTPSLHAIKRPSHWLYFVMQSPTRSVLLDKTLLAVSIARCGKVKKDTVLLTEGRRHYTHALHLLQRTLGDDDESSRDETLAAVALMVLYELLDGSSAGHPNGWHQHLAGLDRLLHHCGPQRCSSRLGKAVLEHSRHILMIRSLFLRKPSVLSQPSWLSVPWNGGEKTTEQQIFDQGLLLADVFERFDGTQDESVVTEILKLTGDCVCIDAALRSIKQRHSNAKPGEDHSLIWDSVSDNWVDPSAQLLLTITALGIQLGACDTACELDRRLASCHSFPVGSGTEEIIRKRKSLPTEVTNRRYLACEIVHWVSMYLATNIGAMGPARLVFALKLARKQFNVEDPEFLDCGYMLEILSGSTWQLGAIVKPIPYKGWWKRSNDRSSSAHGR